jgi:hypothetical protein
MKKPAVPPERAASRPSWAYVSAAPYSLYSAACSQWLSAAFPLTQRTVIQRLEFSVFICPERAWQNNRPAAWVGMSFIPFELATVSFKPLQ